EVVRPLAAVGIAAAREVALGVVLVRHHPRGGRAPPDLARAPVLPIAPTLRREQVAHVVGQAKLGAAVRVLDLRERAATIVRERERAQTLLGDRHEPIAGVPFVPPPARERLALADPVLRGPAERVAPPVRSRAAGQLAIDLEAHHVADDLRLPRLGARTRLGET